MAICFSLGGGGGRGAELLHGFPSVLGRYGHRRIFYPLTPRQNHFRAWSLDVLGLDGLPPSSKRRDVSSRWE